jgi:oligo-alginate lyase
MLMASRRRFGFVVPPLLAGVLSLTACAEDGGWVKPEIKLPGKMAHPRIAATVEELARLRAAWKDAGPARKALAPVVESADKAMQSPVVFPPRGGQHNQWYQCDACQRALARIDDTHHRCPGCNKVYSGPPYDDVIFARVHGANLAATRDAGWAYALTGDAKYAAFAAGILLGYAERYEAYPYHDNFCADGKTKPGKSGGHIFEQTLNEAMHMAREIGPAFDLIHEKLTDAERDTIRKKLIAPMLKNIEKHRAGKSNWQTWHNAAFVWGGACLDDVEWIKRAIEDPANGFIYQMEVSVTGDGMWYENSWGYHFYTLMAMVAITDGARRLGIDLWDHPVYRKMFTLSAFCAMADGTLPRFGDDVNTSAKGPRSQMEAAHHAYKDDAILALLDPEPSFESIMLGRDLSKKAATAPLKSRVFGEAGHAILRSTGPAGLTAAFAFGQFGGFHGHFDKLTFVLYGFGRELGVDPGRAKSQAYRLPIHTDWYRATVAHNAVVVDRKSQDGAAGTLELFGEKDGFSVVRARCDTAYKGVRHQRTLLLTPEYLLVVDDLAVQDRKNHRFDWVYHNRGKSAACDASIKEAALKGFAGAEYMKNLKSGETAGAVRVLFDDDAGQTNLILDAQPGTTVTTGDGVGATVDERVPLAMITRTGASARFAAVIEPCAKGQSAAIKGVTLDEKDGVVTINIAGKEQDTVILDEKSIVVNRGEMKVLSAVK